MNPRPHDSAVVHRWNSPVILPGGLIQPTNGLSAIVEGQLGPRPVTCLHATTSAELSRKCADSGEMPNEVSWEGRLLRNPE